MKLWHNMFRPLLVLLLVLQVSVAYAMPTGLHLDLCIGFDGHLDISLDDCASNPTQPARQLETILYDEAHHDDCLDVAIGCLAAAELRPPSTEVCSSKAKAKRNDLTHGTVHGAFSAVQRIAQFAQRPDPLVNSGTMPPSHLVSLRTIVLLI